MAPHIKKMNVTTTHTAYSGYLIFGNISLACHILEDGLHFLSLKGFNFALGYKGKSENWLHDLLQKLEVTSILTSTATAQISSPVVFSAPSFNKVKKNEKGIAPLVLLEVCHVLINAKENNSLSISELKYFSAAAKILNHVNEETIFIAIDYATGFHFHKEICKKSVMEFMMNQIPDSAFKWITTLPDSFISLLIKMRGLQWHDLENNPRLFAKILHDLVFIRISEELLTDLRNSPPKRDYRRKNKAEQQVQHPALRQYTKSILSLIETSGNNWHIFLRLIDLAYPKVSYSPFLLPGGNIKTPEALSSFNENLLKFLK